MTRSCLLVVAGVIAVALFFALYGRADGRPSHVNYPYHEEIVTYNGRPLHCIVRDGDGYGVGSGMACDFVRYYRGKP